jgi:hypothetical protein
MPIQAVLLPVFVLVALTFGLLIWMGSLRISSIRRGETRIADIALGQQNWPPGVTQVTNAFHNQLQMPCLFYVLTVFALMAKLADLTFVVMAWIFVLARLTHAYIFVTTNDVPARFWAYMLGTAILVLMWLIFAVRLLSAHW